MINHRGVGTTRHVPIPVPQRPCSLQHFRVVSEVLLDDVRSIYQPLLELKRGNANRVGVKLTHVGHADFPTFVNVPLDMGNDPARPIIRAE